MIIFSKSRVLERSNYMKYLGKFDRKKWRFQDLNGPLEPKACWGYTALCIAHSERAACKLCTSRSVPAAIFGKFWENGNCLGNFFLQFVMFFVQCFAIFNVFSTHHWNRLLFLIYKKKKLYLKKKKIFWKKKIIWNLKNKIKGF